MNESINQSIVCLYIHRPYIHRPSTFPGQLCSLLFYITHSSLQASFSIHPLPSPHMSSTPYPPPKYPQTPDPGQASVCDMMLWKQSALVGVCNSGSKSVIKGRVAADSKTRQLRQREADKETQRRSGIYGCKGQRKTIRMHEAG